MSSQLYNNSKASFKKIGPFTSSIFDYWFNEISKPHMRDELKLYIIDPFIDHIAQRLQPYIIVTLCFFSIFFILILLILVLIMKSDS